MSEKSLHSNHTFYRKLTELPQVIHTPEIFLKPGFSESARCNIFSFVGPNSLSATQLCCCSVWEKRISGWGCIPVKLYLRKLPLYIILFILYLSIFPLYIYLWLHFIYRHYLELKFYLILEAWCMKFTRG